MAPQMPLREPEAANYAFFLDLPGSGPDEGQDRRQGLAVPAAALRVLGRLRRLRRDAVRQAADPALRRPGAHRQRDRLLVDLRRQPADDAVRGDQRRARAGLVQLALRGQRRVRLRLPAGGRRPASGSRTSCCGAWPARSATSWSTALIEADQSDEAGIRQQRERVVALRDEARGDPRSPRRGGSTRSPTTW